MREIQNTNITNEEELEIIRRKITYLLKEYKELEDKRNTLIDNASNLQTRYENNKNYSRKRKSFLKDLFGAYLIVPLLLTILAIIANNIWGLVELKESILLVALKLFGIFEIPYVIASPYYIFEYLKLKKIKRDSIKSEDISIVNEMISNINVLMHEKRREIENNKEIERRLDKLLGPIDNISDISMIQENISNYSRNRKKKTGYE